MTLVRLALARHADHARAVPARDLHRGLADFAVDAHHQHGLAAFGHPGTAKSFDRGDKGNADACGLFPRNAFRLVHHRVGLDGKVGGVGAVAADPEVTRWTHHFAADRPT